MTINKNMLPWLETHWQQLSNYQKTNHIPQALLISGARGIGKSLLATEFALSLLCAQPNDEGKHCGICRYCRLAEAGNHPDYFAIAPEDDKKSISVNQIRNVVSDTCLKPQFERSRVIIINPADLLTLSAANAFLKCLEEPGERTVFILITSRLNKLPITIASRCQKITLNMPNRDEIGQWLTKQGIHDDRNRLAQLFKGSLLKPEQLSDSELLKQREDCFSDWLLIAENMAYPVMVAEKWDKVPKTELIDWLVSWVSDTIKIRFSADTLFFYNPDFIQPLQKVAQQLELSCLYRLYDHLLNTRQQLEMQLNFQVMLEEILARWQELNRRNLYG